MFFDDKIIYFGYFGKWLFEKDSASPISNFWLIYGGVILGIALVSYFFGCLNFGIILSKLMYHEDIRTKGSGNAGATNMLRTYGKKMAIATFLGDFLKAAVSVNLGIALMGGLGGFVAAFFCMVGHAFPCFYGFKGGKGVAVAAASVLFLDWRVFLILFAVFVGIVAITKYISLGSVTCLFFFPILFENMNKYVVLNDAGQKMAMYHMPPLTVLVAAMMAFLVIYLHRSNIKRIWNKTESKVSFKSKKKEEGEDDGAEH